MAADVAAVIGKYGERIQNRSLLLDKFVFHKSWPVEYEESGKIMKWDDASRWSFMRIADQSQTIVMAQALKKEQESKGRNVDPEKAQRLRAQADVARRLSNVKWEDQEIEELRARHSRRFLDLIKSALPTRHIVVVGQLESRLAINLSDSLIENAGICLDRLFGLPYIPGSAVKGVCRHAALSELKSARTDDHRRKLLLQFQSVFGTSSAEFASGKKSGALAQYARYLDDPGQQTVKGCVDFLAAYPVNAAKITVDLTTVHYPAYYYSGRQEDLSKEKPIVNPFPVVEQGARFAFCLVANRLTADPEAVLSVTRRWLECALTQSGLGAKTSGGYGWFSLPQDGLQQLEEDARQEQMALEREAQEKQAREEAAKRRQEKLEAEAARAAQRRADEERRKNMTPDELADETVAGWNDDAFLARVRNFNKKKGAPSDAEKRAMVRALREQRGELWTQCKEMAARGGEMAKSVDAIRALCKSMNLGKMP
jgi:CRISPR type III-B/RAMP module RAMP protein Cmr6